MIPPDSVGGVTPPKKFLEYVNELAERSLIKGVLTQIVEEFALFILKGGSPMDKQKAWNYANSHIRQLEYNIRMQIRSDRNRDGFAVDLGG